MMIIVRDGNTKKEKRKKKQLYFLRPQTLIFGSFVALSDMILYIF